MAIELKYCVLYDLNDFTLIGVGSSHRHKFTGFNSEKGIGSMLLTYFTTRALGIWRMPFCEDRIYSDTNILNKEHKDIINSLTEERIEKICNEVKDIYSNTQNNLKKAGMSSVFLKREIRYNENNYAENIIRLKMSSDILNLEEIQIEMDILNSFGDEDGAYCSDVRFELEIPIEDVFYCSQLIANREGNPVTMESGEWVILNRSPTGVKSFPTSSVKFKEDMWKDKIELNKENAESFLREHSPLVIRSRRRFEQQLGTQYLKPTLKQMLCRKLLGCNA